jgi:hypothetical protein
MSQTCSVLYEAEHATAQGVTELKSDTAAWGGMYVDYAKGGFLSWENVIVSDTALYSITVRFNTAGKGRSDLDLWVNGERRAGTRLAKTSKWALYTFTQQLTKGQNTLTLKDVGSDSPNIDAVLVYPIDFSSSTGTVALSQTNMSGADGSITTYSFVVPVGARGVNVAVYNEGYDATPDLDVFVRRGSEPSTSFQDPDYCSSPFGDTEGRHCSYSSVDQPLDGTWYVKVKGWGDYGGGSGEGWELKATYY